MPSNSAGVWRTAKTTLTQNARSSKVDKSLIVPFTPIRSLIRPHRHNQELNNYPDWSLIGTVWVYVGLLRVPVQFAMRAQMGHFASQPAYERPSIVLSRRRRGRAVEQSVQCVRQCSERSWSCNPGDCQVSWWCSALDSEASVRHHIAAHCDNECRNGQCLLRLLFVLSTHRTNEPRRCQRTKKQGGDKAQEGVIVEQLRRVSDRRFVLGAGIFDVGIM